MLFFLLGGKEEKWKQDDFFWYEYNKENDKIRMLQTWK